MSYTHECNRLYKDVVRLLFFINDDKIKKIVDENFLKKDYDELLKIHDLLNTILINKKIKRENAIYSTEITYINHCKEIDYIKIYENINYTLCRSIEEAIESGYWN